MANGFLQGLQTGQGLGQSFVAGRQRRKQAPSVQLQQQAAQQLPLLVEGARRVKLLQDPESKLRLLETLRGNFERAGLSTEVLDQGIGQLQGGDLEGFERATDDIIGLGQQLAGGAAERASAPVGLEGGGLGFPVFSPSTGKGRMEVIPGAVGETPEQKRQSTVQAAISTETGKLVAGQRQEIRTEITKNARNARRQIPDLERLLTALETTGTGLTTQAVATFGRFLPGVDPTDEQALSSQINNLVLDKLQFFPGAISEGERAFAQRTTANLGNTTEANRIILNHAIETLRRAETEQNQFKSFVKGGGKPENFEFQVVQAKDVTVDQLQGLSDEELNRLLK